jgi:SAM-dependent methyltransferase
MEHRLYTDLASWWPVLRPPENYVEETAYALNLLQQAADAPLQSLLELGSGGGHLAHWLPAQLHVTLVDLAPDMLTASRALNPDREHVLGDMRNLNLERTFDAVLLHDAVCYMNTEEDLRAALATAASHVRPGGAVLILPDAVADDWQPGTEAYANRVGDRQASYLEWQHSQEGSTVTCDYVFLFKDGDNPVFSARDTHVVGLFDRATWWRLIGSVGLTLEAPTLAPPFTPYGEVLLARR